MFLNFVFFVEEAHEPFLHLLSKIPDPSMHSDVSSTFSWLSQSGTETTLSDLGIESSGLVAAAVGSTASDTRADEPLLLSISGRAHLIGHLISICEVVAQQLPIEEAQP